MTKIIIPFIVGGKINSRLRLIVQEKAIHIRIKVGLGRRVRVANVCHHVIVDCRIGRFDANIVRITHIACTNSVITTYLDAFVCV